ncbi:hypothetical protein [Methanobrevibacter ruminantium]|nr:hypothetical protein [Methanobrevibacter ruminantium]
MSIHYFFKFKQKNTLIVKEKKKVVLSGVEPESQVPETRMIAITP